MSFAEDINNGNAFTCKTCSDIVLFALEHVTVHVVNDSCLTRIPTNKTVDLFDADISNGLYFVYKARSWVILGGPHKTQSLFGGAE